MHKILSFFKVEIRALLREPVSIFFMVVLPVVLTVVFGGAFGKEVTRYGSDVLGIDTVVPVNIIFLLANTGLMGIPITILELKEQGVLKRYATYPIKYRTYFSSLVITFALVSVASIALFVSVAFVFYSAKLHMTLSESLLALVLCLLVAYVFFGVGFLLALTIKSTRTANLLSSGLFMSMLFTSGVVLPIESLPVYVQKAAMLLPMSHGVEALQALWVGRSEWSAIQGNVLYLVAASVVMSLVLRVVRIKWDA